MTPKIFIAVLLFVTLGQITADMYLPSLPAITEALSSTPAMIKLTLSVYLLGFSVSHLFYGPISDRIGRRKPILFGMGLSILGSLICFSASSAIVLIAGRFLQGIGTGACTSIGRSISRDLLSGSHLARTSSQLGMAGAFVLASSPMIGGYIQHYLSWRMNFFILFLYTSCIFIFVYHVLPETNQHLDPMATRLKVACRNYTVLLFNRTFISYTFCAAMAYAGLAAYLTIAPFLFQTVIGLNPVQFGWLSFFIGAGILTSGFINSRYVVHKGIPFMLRLGTFCMMTSGVLMLLLGLGGLLNVAVIVLPLMLFCVGTSLSFANASAGAFHAFPEMAGTAAALYGCFQVLGGATASGLAAKLHAHNQIPLAILFVVLGSLSFLSLTYGVGKESP
ncbi:MAG: hypothetical protein ACD_60C00024G0003 [uncultured bacterium]|nr:MAG: hypothetical protein ACD_60C00024G0003 [uncultured bacterium]